MIENDDFFDDTTILFKTQYDFFQKSKDVVYANAKVKSFEIVIKRSQIDKFIEKIRRCDMICSKNIIYKTRIRKSQRDNNFIKIDCFWLVILIKYKNEKNWLLCSLTTNHNHSSTKLKKIFVFSNIRRRDMKNVFDAIEQIAKQFSKIIFDNIRAQNSNIIVQKKNVYNARAKIQKKRLDKYFFIQILLRILYKNNWFVKFLLKKSSKKIKSKSRIQHQLHD